MAHAESDVQSPTHLPTPIASMEGPTGPIPMNCRGMELLGFACSGTVYFCVHQCSVELWKLYDTPRVSIQKKILDLRIQLTNCNREQIKQLREAGIIENFRATMIALRDTERLFDALEYSRKKRGLLKHALKAKSDPSQRILRVEERRARRLKAKSLVCEEPKRVHVDSTAYARGNFSQQECALNGDTEVPDVYCCTDKLLVAEDAVQTLDTTCEHSIEVISNDVQLAGELDVQNCVPIQRMEHSILLDTSSSADHQYACSLESPRSSESSFPSLLCPKSVTSRSRLSSPAFEASEVEEVRSTCSTYSNSLRSLSGSPRRQSSTPDRFLFLDSDSASEGEFEPRESSVLPLNSLVANTGVSAHSGGSQSVLHSGQTTDFCVQNSTGVLAEEDPTSKCTRENHQPRPPTLNHKRPIVLKLRHLAQATSPSSKTTVVNLPSHKSLIVSVPLSLLKNCTGTTDTTRNHFQKGKRGVALSSFVTKKRANSRTLSRSSSSEGSVSSDPTYYPRAGNMARKSRGHVKQHINTSKHSLKGRRKFGPRGRNRSKSDEVLPLISTDLSDGRKARSDLAPRRRWSAASKDHKARSDAPSRRWSAASKEDHSPMDIGLPWDLAETRLCQKEKTVEEKMTGATCVSASCNSNENNRTHAITGNFAGQYGCSEPQSNGTSNGCLPQDDDQLSITSSSTNSTTSSFKGGTSSRRSTRNKITYKAGKNELDATCMKFTFSFEDLFSFCPPKLILKDGELVPEKSLLEKDLTRHNIPEGHPLLKWTLGQPVKGAAVAKKIASRKRRSCKNLEK